jgi:hypothetical protein
LDTQVINKVFNIPYANLSPKVSNWLHPIANFEAEIMKGDIEYPEVRDVSVAAVLDDTDWNVYLINHKDVPLEGVLVSSRGYGKIGEDEVETSVLRHFLETVNAKSFVKIEPILEDVFCLNNEYWLSFYINGVIYDKKYIFLPETINSSFFTTVPIIGKKGVLIS